MLLLLCKTLAMSIWYGYTGTLFVAFGRFVRYFKVLFVLKRCSHYVPMPAVQTRSSRKTFDLSSRPTRSLSSRYVMSSQPAGLNIDSSRS
jgi:hypothetical protein